MTEEDAYIEALNELQKNKTIPGVWAKAMAFSEGDERKAKANYMKFRAEQILKKYRGYGAEDSGLKVFHILFSPSGRMTRGPFSIISISCLMVFFALMWIIGEQSSGYGYYKETHEAGVIMCIPFILIDIWIFLCAHLKRARDFGESANIVYIYLFPVVGWVWFLAFLFVESKEDKEEPRQNI